MLFNSFQFLFLFLPVTVVVGLWLQRRNRAAFVAWMILASLVFYGSWHPSTIWILVASLLVNYGAARLMQAGSSAAARKAWLIAGLAWNLGLLGYFKYTNFLADTIGMATGEHPGWAEVILPVGISFFTFQKIAFLVDAYRGPDQIPTFSRFALFVMFFPQLIAGPIVHHREFIPQIDRRNDRLWENLAVGLTMLAIGLVKKLYIADAAALPASALFDATASGAVPTFGDAWFGALGYTVQIYFDFSAYSDMALGLARLFGFDLPINFVSPYKATSIVDFWRRWHVTLSRFLRDYLYIPLGGNRKGPARQQLNLFLTMLLGGIWHGAGFTFVLWGAMHGVYLLVAHGFGRSALGRALAGSASWRAAAWLLTFIAVVFAWVPFRAADLRTTVEVWSAMLQLPAALAGFDLVDNDHGVVIGIGLLVAFLAPNAYEIMADYRVGLPSPGYPATSVARPARVLAFPGFTAFRGALLGLMAAAVVIKLNDISAFIYFQF